MTDVSFFWIAFAAYLAAMFVLAAAALHPGGERMARVGRALVWLGLAAQTVSIVWRAFLLCTAPTQMFFERLAKSFSAGPAWQAATFACLLLVAAATAAIVAVFRRQRIVWLLTLGVAIILELILLDFLDFTRMPIEKVYEYLSLASWCAALALLALSPMLRLAAVDAALALCASLLTVFAAIQPKAIELQLVPALQSYWLFIHVSLTSIAYAIFGIAFVLAALFLIKTYRPEAMAPGTRGRLCLASLIAKGAAAVLILVLVLGGIILPFREVAYAPHELAKEGAASPPIGTIQVVRYGAALLGAFGVAAYALVWAVYPFLRPKEDRSGLGSYVFVVSSTALFAGCLILGGLVRGQEQAIEDGWEEQRELRRVVEDVAPPDGGPLTDDTLKRDIAHWRDLSHLARRILSQARWLPLTLEKQETLAKDREFQALQQLYQGAGAEWRLPIRYKDIKQIGRDLGRRADVTEALLPRLDLPASREQLERLEVTFQRASDTRQAGALLPRRAEGQIAAFVGVAMLIAVPIGLALYFLLPRVSGRLPEAGRLDRISYGAVAVGYPLFTFGALFAGAIWAHFAWGSWWSWDPKEVGSLVGWVLFTVYLHQRYREGLSPRTAAVAAILGYIACTLSLAGNSFLGGLHSYS